MRQDLSSYVRIPIRWQALQNELHLWNVCHVFAIFTNDQ